MPRHNFPDGVERNDAMGPSRSIVRQRYCRWRRRRMPRSQHEVVGRPNGRALDGPDVALALERNGLVSERDGGGQYRGNTLFATCNCCRRLHRVETLVTAADPTLQRLSEETGETVNLAVPSSTGVVQVAQIDSTFVLGVMNWVDVEVPPHCSALGKTTYAFDIIPYSRPLRWPTVHLGVPERAPGQPRRGARTWIRDRAPRVRRGPRCPGRTRERRRRPGDWR